MSVVSSSPPLAAAATVAPSWRERAALLLLTALAIAVRLFRIEQWSWSNDEAATWRAITQPLAGEGGFVTSTAGNSPLVYLLLRWFIDNDVLPGTGEASLRLPFAFAGACTVPLVALVARPWIGGRAALLAGLLLAVHPLHVLASQTAAPLVIAMPIQLAAIALAARRALWGSAVCSLVAGLCMPGAWFAFAGVGVVLLPGRARRPALLACAAMALPQWLLAVPQLAWPIVVCGLLAAVCAAPLPAVVVGAVALPAAMGWFAAGDPRSSALVLTLPLLVIVAAHGLATVSVWVQLGQLGQLGMVSRGAWRTLGATAPGLLACTGLTVATALDLTVYRGQRPAWQQAAQVALRTVTAGGRLVVGAAAGHGPLQCYLRPQHHGSRGDDPHPRRIVQEVALHDGETALRALLDASGTARAVLVLTTGERDSLMSQPAAAALLVSAFACSAVLPGPSGDHDEGLLLWIERNPG